MHSPLVLLASLFVLFSISLVTFSLVQVEDSYCLMMI